MGTGHWGQGGQGGQGRIIEQVSSLSPPSLLSSLSLPNTQYPIFRITLLD